MTTTGNSGEKKEYRSKAKIYADILDALMRAGGKSGPTRLLYGANLSYDRLKMHINQLVQLQLVAEEKQAEDKTVYKITQKGMEFLKEFMRIEKFAEAFGIPI